MAIARSAAMARTNKSARKQRARKRARRTTRIRRGVGGRAHASAVRREAAEVRDRVYEAGRQVQRAGEASAQNLGRAGTKLRKAGEASVDLARETAQLAGVRASEAAEQARERLTEATETARERVGDVVGKAQETVADTAVDLGRKAVQMTVKLLTLPIRVRARARQGAEVMEEAGTRVVSSVLHTGSKVLDLAADYVAELTPRRGVNRAALERLLVEQLAWARLGAEVFDRAAAAIEDDVGRVRLVRGKLQLVRQQELLAMLVRAVGGSVPSDDRMPEVTPVGLPDDGSRAALAAALSVAEHAATSWQAIEQIGASAEDDEVAEALVRAAESVGPEPHGQVEFLRERVALATVESVLT
jgi:hypothetical protein